MQFSHALLTDFANTYSLEEFCGKTQSWICGPSDFFQARCVSPVWNAHILQKCPSSVWKGTKQKKIENFHTKCKGIQNLQAYFENYNSLYISSVSLSPFTWLYFCSHLFCLGLGVWKHRRKKTNRNKKKNSVAKILPKAEYKKLKNIMTFLCQCCRHKKISGGT